MCFFCDFFKFTVKSEERFHEEGRGMGHRFWSFSSSQNSLFKEFDTDETWLGLTKNGESPILSKRVYHLRWWDVLSYATSNLKTEVAIYYVLFATSTNETKWVGLGFITDPLSANEP